MSEDFNPFKTICIQMTNLVGLEHLASTEIHMSRIEERIEESLEYIHATLTGWLPVVVACTYGGL